jgi:L-amino acid N-acyltransferase YncA
MTSEDVWRVAMITIRKAQESDFDSIWEIFHQIVAQGDTYPYDPDTTKDQAYFIWMSKDVTTYVACMDEVVVGTYILKSNQPGLGSHVANAGYMVKSDYVRKGIGKAMCEHSLMEARKAGFLAMQFNFVVSTNARAIALWKKMGFSIVGTLPKVFQYKRLGLVDAYVMHRFL